LNIVHFDGAAKAAGSVVANTLGALRDKIKEKFSSECVGCDAHKLIVQIKVADKLLPLDNDPKLKLEGLVLCVGGDYDVYNTLLKNQKSQKQFISVSQ